MRPPVTRQADGTSVDSPSCQLGESTEASTWPTVQGSSMALAAPPAPVPFPWPDMPRPPESTGEHGKGGTPVPANVTAATSRSSRPYSFFAV